MKAKDLALPIIALAIAGIVLGTQRKNASEMRSANEELLATLDRIDAMELDDKNAARTRFESAVVFGLFAADPAKAEARLSNLSPTLREEILRKADDFHKMGEGDEIAFAEIVRRQLDEMGRVAAIAERAGKVIGRGGDFAAVDEYLNSVYAAPDERESSAETAARKHNEYFARKGEMSASKLEAMRAWVSRDAPESVNRLTGEALGGAVNAIAGMDFEGASSLALGYRETTGKDEVLHDFLSSLRPGPNNAEARKLAEKISDPMSKDGFLRKFE